MERKEKKDEQINKKMPAPNVVAGDSAVDKLLKIKENIKKKYKL